MKRLLACLFLVLGLGLIFSGSTFAKKKVYFCKQPGSSNIIPVISSTPCSKISINSMFKKWKTISAKRYITYIIDAYGQGDAIIQSLYDDFEKHNLGTNIIREITKKEKKKKKTLVAKKKENARISNYSGELDAGGAKGVIALCLNEKNLNKVRLSYFNDLSTYKKNGSFKNGECNYVVDKILNEVLFHFLLTTTLNKGKYEIKKKYIDEYVDWAREINYVTPEGKMIEVVSLVFFKEPSQTQEVVEKSDKKKKKWTGKPFSRKKLVSFIPSGYIL